MKWQNGNFFDDSVAQKSCWVQFWGPKYMYYVTPKPILDIFWADRPRFNAKMSRQCPDAPFAVSGYAFDAFLANWRPIFQKENAWNTRFTKYRNTVGKYEKYKNGVCYAIVPSRDFWKCVIWGATVEWPRVNKERNLCPNCQKSAKMCIFGAKNADFDPKIRILGPKSKTLCTTTMVCQYGNFFVLTVLHRKLLRGAPRPILGPKYTYFFTPKPISDIFLGRPTRIQWENVEATSWRFRWCVWTCIRCFFGRLAAHFPEGNTRNTLFTKYRNTVWKCEKY